MTSGALVARARGLATRLATDDALAALERAPDAPALASALALIGITPAATGPDLLDAVDAAVRERVARDLAVLQRWAAPADPGLRVVALDEDHRSLRALVRGIAGGVSVRARLAGTLPTPTLPAAALDALAHATTYAALAARLTALAHPLAPALTGPLAAPHPDLLALEVALTRAFVTAARAAATRDPALAAYVAQLVDVTNATTALLRAARGPSLAPGPLFLAGGARVTRAVFDAATPSLDAARTTLGAAFTGTPLAQALFDAAPAAIEDAALRWALADQARRRRTTPAGLAPVLHVLLRRRLEARRIRGAAWRLALGGVP